MRGLASLTASSYVEELSQLEDHFKTLLPLPPLLPTSQTPISLDLSQTNLLNKMRLCFGKKGLPHVLDAIIDGACFGYIALWLYGMRLQELERDHMKRPQDYSWFIKTLTNIATWDEEDPDAIFTDALELADALIAHHAPYYQWNKELQANIADWFSDSKGRKFVSLENTIWLLGPNNPELQTDLVRLFNHYLYSSTGSSIFLSTNIHAMGIHMTGATAGYFNDGFNPGCSYFFDTFEKLAAHIVQILANLEAPFLALNKCSLSADPATKPTICSYAIGTSATEQSYKVLCENYALPREIHDFLMRFRLPSAPTVIRSPSINTIMPHTSELKKSMMNAYHAGQFAEAAKHFERYFAMDHTINVLYFECYVVCLNTLREHKKALTFLNQAIAGMEVSGFATQDLAWFYAQRGKLLTPWRTVTSEAHLQPARETEFTRG